jgi:hypothetical protein
VNAAARRSPAGPTTERMPSENTARIGMEGKPLAARADGFAVCAASALVFLRMNITLGEPSLEIWRGLDPRGRSAYA